MRQVQLTITYRFLERAIYILIILLLLFLLISKYTEDTSCDCPDVDEQEVPTTTPSGDDTDDTQTDTTEEDATDDTTDTTDTTDTEDQTDETDDATDTSDEEDTSTTGQVTVEMGDIDFDIQNDSRAKINNIKISVENGLSDDIKLFATIKLFESGNDDIDVVNPFWDQEEMPLVPAGETKLVTVEPSKHWPPGVEDGDTISVEGEFTDFQGNINVSAQKVQDVG